MASTNLLINGNHSYSIKDTKDRQIGFLLKPYDQGTLPT